MATLAQLEAALIAADKAGNAEDARVLAAEVRRMRGQNSPGAVKDFAGQFLAGAAEMPIGLGELVESTPIGTARDVVESGLESAGLPSPFIHPDDARKALPEPTDTLAGRAGYMAGLSTGIAVPIGTGAAGLPRLANETGGILERTIKGARNLLSDYGQTFKDKPIRTTTVEAGLGATAGAGGYAAEWLYPESEHARLYGELVGGVAPAFMPAALVVRGAGWLRQKATKPFSSAGARMRGADRIYRATPDTGRAISWLDAPTTIDPRTGRPVLSLAQRTGEAGLLALERAVVESSEQLSRQYDEQIAHASSVIKQSMRESGGTGTAEDAQSYLSYLLNTRMKIAAEKSRERISRIGNTVSRERANEIAAEEVEAAMRAAREQENELYRRIPMNTEVTTANTAMALETALSEIGEAQIGDVPRVARTLLENWSQNEGRTTIREVRSLQGRLRQIARNARASGPNQNYNKARIADNLADALTEDISMSAGNVSEDVATAVNFSRELNQTFKQGTVGKLLGRDAIGTERIPASLTLERTIAGGKAASREAYDQIVRALDNPNLPGSSEGFRAAAGNYMRTLFLKHTVKNGRVQPQSAKSFLSANEELLKRMPDVRTQLEAAARDAKGLEAIRSIAGDPKVSKAALFIQDAPDAAFKRILKQGPKAAEKDVQNLINMAAKDKTGAAASGLKSSFIDFLMSGAETGARDVAGETVVSGYALKELMQNPSTAAAMKRLFSPAERKRLGVLVEDLVRLDKTREGKAAVEGIIGDKPAMIVERAAGIFGAAAGRNMGRAMGSGGTVQIPGQTANMLRDLVRSGVKDPATQFIKDALLDETLFREVLIDGVKNGELTKPAARKLNAWLGAMLLERGEDDQS